jgi:hypothetical protein
VIASPTSFASWLALRSQEAVGSVTPAIIGAMQDRGMTLASAMASCIVLAGVLVIVTVWMGPETLCRQFETTD